MRKVELLPNRDREAGYGPALVILIKAYSLISYRGGSQKCQNLNFLHLFVAFLQEGHFPKGI